MTGLHAPKMSKRVPPLTQLEIRNAKPRDKSYKLADGGGLYLEVMPTGSKLWRLKYRRPDGSENRLSFGGYPNVSLADARTKRDAIRKIIAAGGDPAQVREIAAREARRASGNTFEKVAREWHGSLLKTWRPQTAKDILNRLERDIYPSFGHLPIDQVEPSDVLDAIRSVEKRGALEIAKRLLQNCVRIFRYAKRCGYVRFNPAEDLREVLEPQEENHFAAIGPDDLPGFLRALYQNQASMGLPTRIAMHLMLLLFVRTSELIETPWTEIDEAVLRSADWIIPWQRMKRGKRRVKPNKNDHHVPLPRQAKALLQELRQLTGHGIYLFPNTRDPHRPMSNNTLLKAIERMGYKGDMTGHGFRALAMTTLKERLGYRHEVVDRQLAHAQKDKLESAYDRARYMNERREMMQRWADYVEEVAANSLVSQGST